MKMGTKIVRRLARGYRLLTSGEEDLSARAKKPLPVKQTEPLEVSGALKLIEPEKKEEKIEIEGFEIPDFKKRRVRISKIKSKIEKEIYSGSYPLIPPKPKKGEPLLAYAKIFWDPKQHGYVYNVVEPKISKELMGMILKIKELLEQRLDVDFSKLKKFEVRDYLKKQIKELVEYFDFRATATERDIIQYYIERDFIGLGRIEPIMQDPNIEDISCDGVGIPVFIFHREPKVASVKTNVVFDNAEELDSFVTRLSQLCGKSISVASPLIDGSLPDGSRLQATLATDIARRGSNFTIRKFTKTPLTPTHLMQYKTLDIKTAAFLWYMVDSGKSILIPGGTASGKTTLLNVLSLFIRPDKKIISMEDTAELQLPHPHWVPTVARVSIGKGESRGEVDLFDLLKESLRQRPDYIIVGEVRGPEAYILFQQMATGHPSLATIHAENIPKLMDRLTTPPISLPATLLGSLDLIVFLGRMRYREKFIRRVTEITEMIKYDPKTGKPVVNTVFKWNSTDDKFDVVGKSMNLKKIADQTGVKEKDVKDELERRMMVMKWMKENNINNYVDVSKVVNAYYTNPQETLAAMLD
jgi:flagellar protein FlaI